jgi:hypothetical protein
MRLIVTIYLMILTCVNVYSQTRFCEENASMYSKCYNLDSNGHFTFHYSNCTGAIIGAGTYTKKKKSIAFQFDSLQSPQIQKTNNNDTSGKVIFYYSHITSGYHMESAEIDYEGQIYRTDSLGKVEIDYSGV